MKKILIAISCIIGMAAYIYGMGDTTSAKKTLCDKGCEVAYEACVKAAGAAAEKITSTKQAEYKKKADEAVCTKGKDACFKKCAAEFTAQPAQTTTQK
jgi:hypothetical protein